MATRSRFSSGKTIQGWSPLRTVGSSRSGTDPVASRPRSRIGSDSCSHVPSHEDPASAFRVILLRRLRLPLPLSLHMCRMCVLGRRGFALESVAARICREAGGRVTSNVMVRDLDLPVPDTSDSRRLEVVVDGLPLYGGCQLAVDTTLVCALHCDGSLHRGAADAVGVVAQAARRRKERTYPEIVGPRSRARLVVLAVEVGGRWSSETGSFVASWRRHVPGKNHHFSEGGLSKLGA